MKDINSELDSERAATKLAAAILLDRGEMSVSDIEAMPFVLNEQMALNIMERLKKAFDTETSRRAVKPSLNRLYEDTIVLHGFKQKSN